LYEFASAYNYLQVVEFASTGICLSVSCLGICKYWNLKVKYNFREVWHLKVMEFDSRGNRGGICN